MKRKTFTLRIDLESNKGIKEGLPKLLDLLKKYRLKASFYLPMGGESNIFELLSNRGKIKSAGKRTIKIFSLFEKLRIAFFPKDFVKSNILILRRILEEGHELGIHGWKHREWTRDLEHIDVEKKIQMSRLKYMQLFGEEPISFASPGFNTNSIVVKSLKNQNFLFVSDFEGKKITKSNGLTNVPITIVGNKKTPIIEYLFSKNKTDKEILNYLEKFCKKQDIFSFYIHGMFEARLKIKLLEDIFKFVKKEKYLNKRIIDHN
jgi:peptidoglycan/xylan/chitin deacetylase (PgdA/CDA1 family)